MRIRTARREDLAAIAAIEATCFTAYRLSRRRLSYLLARRRTVIVLVAEIGGRVAGEGVALLRRHGRSMSGRAYSLAVDPAYRGRGIGERLMREMIQRMQARGAGRICLEVEAGNRAAVGLYERLGFRDEKRLSEYYGAGRDGVKMVLAAGRRTVLVAA